MLFFVAMSEATHPGSRDWLSGICKPAGFAPRILQDVDLESGIMTFVAEGLGVTLARQGHHPEAVAHYREALRLKPDYPEALRQLSNETRAPAQP